jgi:hypothetical protein
MAKDVTFYLSFDRPEYLIGEPIIAYVELTNSGTEPFSVIDQLDPLYGNVEFYIKKENLKQFIFVPYVVADSAIHKVILFPNQSIDEEIKIFFGGNGWTFDSPGEYQIQCSYRGLVDNPDKAIESNIAKISVKQPDDEQEEEQTKLIMGKEQGKFLLFESGDHLIEGINALSKLVEKYPQSRLAKYCIYALGKNYSVDFKDFRNGIIRKADLEKSISDLNSVKGEELGSYFKKETYLTLANVLNKSGNTSQAKETVEEFIKLSLNDKRNSQNITKAKEMLDNL